MLKPESILENEMHKSLWDFKIKTYHLISARQLDLVIVNNKENLPNNGHCCSDKVKIIKSKVRDKYLILAYFIMPFFNILSVLRLSDQILSGNMVQFFVLTVYILG